MRKDAGGLENLVAFARLFGYVRHFHPSDEAAQTDWDAFAIAGVGQVEAVRGPRALAAKLEQLFLPLAPTVRVWPSEHPMPAVDFGGAHSTAICWRHVGYGTGRRIGGVVYGGKRVKRRRASGTLPAPVVADLGGGVRAAVPLALWLDESGKSLPGALAPTAPATECVTTDARAVWLASVVIAWNVLQHFYPYFDVVETDWPQALRTALASATEDGSEAAFLTTLRRMLAALHDGHAQIFTDEEPAPVGWDWVEGRLIITDVPDAEGQAIAVGDAVTKVEGRPVEKVVAELETLISAATPQWRRHRVLQVLGAGDPEGTLALEVESFRDPGKRHTITLARRVSRTPVRECRPEAVAQVAPSIWYVDLTRIGAAEWDAALPRLVAGSGIMLDLRGYPNPTELGFEFLRHLSPTPMRSPQMHMPVITAPDQAAVRFVRKHEWELTPEEPFLCAPKVVLADARELSYRETCLGVIEHYRLATIVGGPSGGTNGCSTGCHLPAGCYMPFTGMRVLKQDGSQHHGVGILPDVPAGRTRAGVAARRDEVLERGLEVLQRSSVR